MSQTQPSLTERLQANAARRQAEYEATKAQTREVLAEQGGLMRDSAAGFASTLQDLSRPVPMTAFAGITIGKDSVTYKGEARPLEGVVAHVETAGELTRRATLTRTAVGGFIFGGAGAIVGALLTKKKDTRALYLMVEGPEFAWVVKVPFRQDQSARRFAATLSAAGRSV